MTPARGTLLALVLAALLAGCAGGPSAPAAPEPAGPGPHLLALDGRWEFPRATGEALLSAAGVGPVLGEGLFGGGILRKGDASLAFDHAALDEGALRGLGLGRAPPEAGTVVLSSAYASEHGLSVGDETRLLAWGWPVPLVATSFEMDRTRACDPDAPAKLCFAPPPEPTVTELRLRVSPGAQDLAFLPDLAELGAGGAPAWWNGTFRSPSGEEFPFQAHADRSGAPTPGGRNGTLEPGTWVIRYSLDTLKGRAPAGLAGIVRLREPGYQWFDDRVQAYPTPQAQAEAMLARGQPAELTLRVAAVEAFPANLSAFHGLLSPEDARALRGVEPGQVGGLVVMAGPDAAGNLSRARERTLDPVTPALQLRPLGPPLPLPPMGSALVFRAPLDVDPARLPPVEGGGGPTKALALRPPLAAGVAVDGKNLSVQTRFLALAGPAPWTMPAPARWPTAAEALENLSRSRTLVLGSADLAPPGIITSRLVLGDEQGGRVAVLVGRVEGGPGGTFWASAAFAAGAGEPLSAVVVLPLDPGADAQEVARRARDAWGPLGLALEASSKA